jgi:hypothetical protein
MDPLQERKVNNMELDVTALDLLPAADTAGLRKCTVTCTKPTCSRTCSATCDTTSF